MRKVFVLAALFSALSVFASAASADRDGRYYNGKYEDYYDGHGYYDNGGGKRQDDSVQLGPRPFYLVEGMDESKLKDRLMQCKSSCCERSKSGGLPTDPEPNDLRRCRKDVTQPQ